MDTVIDPAKIFLLANMALSFYLVGTIWAAEMDIFRSWKLIDSKDFHTVLGPVDIHFNAMTVAARLIMAAKL